MVYSWYSSLVFTPYWALLLGGAFVVCITLSSAPWCFEHCGIGRWLQTSGRWSVVLKSRIWSYPGGDKYSFVDDVCPQYLHCTDEDQQSETARLSTVDIALWCLHLIEHCCWGVPLSFALRLAQHLGVLSTVALAGGYRQVAGGRWYWSHESGATQAEINIHLSMMSALSIYTVLMRTNSPKQPGCLQLI